MTGGTERDCSKRKSAYDIHNNAIMDVAMGKRDGLICAKRFAAGTGLDQALTSIIHESSPRVLWRAFPNDRSANALIQSLM